MTGQLLRMTRTVAQNDGAVAQNDGAVAQNDGAVAQNDGAGRCLGIGDQLFTGRRTKLN